MNRKERRVTAAQGRRQQKPTEKAEVSIASRLIALEQGLATFTKVHAENARVINSGFGLQDQHLAVHYRVLNDIRKGEVLVDEHGDIAFTFYHQIYGAVRALVDFFATLGRQPMPTSLVKPNVTDADLVPLPDFGGDHAGA